MHRGWKHLHSKLPIRSKGQRSISLTANLSAYNQVVQSIALVLVIFGLTPVANSVSVNFLSYHFISDDAFDVIARP